MLEITTSLSSFLLKRLKAADELWVAVGLINSKGQQFIENNIKPSCKQHYLIGIDLPSEPIAIKRLFNKRYSKEVQIKISTAKAFYHPKVYLIRKGKTYTAFVGSANCTNGALYSNIEIGISINTAKECKELIEWFGVHFDASKPLTADFIRRYEKRYKVRKERKLKEEMEAQDEKRELIRQYEISMSNRAQFISQLKRYRKQKRYAQIKQTRKENIRDLRQSLDYPQFQNIDLDRFFSIYELGHIISIPKPSINRNMGKFKKLLHNLCDDTLDVTERLEKALWGNLKIRGINMALLTKVLTIHNPKEYYVQNDKSETALRRYGIELPRGLITTERYRITTNFLKEICKVTNIEDLAVLDNFLYVMASENQDHNG